ncbi:hypothetical protein [Helicobacter sp. T3_23-1056]
MHRGQIISLENDISTDLTFQKTSSNLFLNYNDDRIGIFLNFKGHLRISWSFDIKHNKNIDLIFFPETNPYINYAVLYAKDFQKSIDDESHMPRDLGDMRIPYDINYDFAKEILSKVGFSESQQKRFFDVRFGSVLVPIEVEFEWYLINLGELNRKPFNFSVITFPKYDKYLTALNWADGLECILCLGIIKSHKILPQNTTLNFPESIASWEDIEYNKTTLMNETITKHLLPYAEVFKPLPTSALAITKTNINDFIVNVRDKPDLKEGKIIAQLLSQSTNTPNIYITDSNGLTDGNIKPLYKPMLQKGKEWYERDDLGSSDEIGYILYYNHKMAQSYYESNKSKLINPLFRDNYLVLIWDILPNDWCKVWILKMIDKNTISSEDNETKFSEVEFDIFRFREQLLPFIDGYAKTFNKTPSTLKLYEGYIHSSGLEYLAPFGENYIKR